MNRKELELAIALGVATLEDFEGFEPAEVREIKASMPYGELAVPALVAKAPSAEQIASKTISMIFNVQVPDRMGDLLMSNPTDAKKFGGKGWETDRFLHAGGPYLHGHDHAFTIGKVLELRVEKVSMPNDAASEDKHCSGKPHRHPRKPHKSFHALTGDVQFLDSEHLPFSQGDFLLTLEGLTASSVGYIPKVRTYIEDEKEREKLGLGLFGTVQSTMELLEISKVAVPANQWAAGSKAIDDLVAKGLMEESLASDYKRIRIEEPAARVHSKLKVLVSGTELQLECLDGVCKPCELSNEVTVTLEGASASGAEFTAIPIEEHDQVIAELGVDSMSGAPEAIRALKSIPPNERALLRLQGVFDKASEMTELMALVLDELGDDGDPSNLRVENGLHMNENSGVSALAECIRGLLAGRPEALTQLKALEVSGGPVVPSEGTSDGEPATGGEVRVASRVSETELALAQSLDDLVGRLDA